jgi:hypothetical protein
VKGHVLKTSTQGSFLDIAHQNVWYSKDSVANVLSFHQLEVDGHSPSYDQLKKAFIVRTPNHGVMTFTWDDHVEHYVCDFREHMKTQKARVRTLTTDIVRVLTTIAENSAKYPKRQVKSAGQASGLLARAGFPSTGKLAELINSGNLTNTSVSVQDIERALQIFGPSVPGLKGKTQKKQPTQLPLEIPRTVVRGPLTLHIDVIFCRGVPYLLSVSTPLGYIMTDVLSAGATPVSYDDMEDLVRSDKALKRSLFQMLNKYRAKNYAVNTILTDNEGGITKLEGELSALGCHVIPCGPGQHIALVEHKAKLVKQRRRCHLHHVPFAIPLLMEMYLIYHCVFTLNCMPTATRGDHVAPAVDFLGRKLNSERDLRFVWGDLCQAYNTDNTITNSDRARTDTCVLLLSTGNLNGSVKMMNLSTWRIITRDQWTVIPYDEPTLMMITAKALKDEVALSTRQRQAYRAKDAIFRRVYQPLSDSLDYEEPPAMVMPAETPPVLHGAAPVDTPEEETHLRPSVVPDSSDVPTDDQRGESEGVPPIPIVSSPVRQSITDEHVSPPTDTVPEVEVTTEPSVSVPKPSEPAPPAPSPTKAAPPVQRYNLRHPKRYPTTSLPSGKAILLEPGDKRRILSFSTRASFFRRSKQVYVYATTKKDIINHITPRQALKKSHLRANAIESMISELRSLVKKESFSGIHISQLTEEQRKKIIRSSMFLKEKYKTQVTTCGWWSHARPFRDGRRVITSCVHHECKRISRHSC